MKKMLIQEFDKDYILINEKELRFEHYPEKEDFDYIAKNAYHEEHKQFVINYMGMLADISMGAIGKHRMDGVPFGFNAFIFTIRYEEETS